jgi:hypothetical protein
MKIELGKLNSSRMVSGLDTVQHSTHSGKVHQLLGERHVDIVEHHNSAASGQASATLSL